MIVPIIVKKKKYAWLLAPNLQIRRTVTAMVIRKTTFVEPMKANAIMIDVNHGDSKPWMAKVTDPSKAQVIPLRIAITMKVKAPPNKIHKPIAMDGRMVNSFNYIILPNAEYCTGIS